MDAGDKRNRNPVNIRILCRRIERMGDGGRRISELHDEWGRILVSPTTGYAATALRSLFHLSSGRMGGRGRGHDLSYHGWRPALGGAGERHDGGALCGALPQ